MLRIAALPALAVLAACQMTAPPQTTTREDRIAMGLNTISDCAQSECGRLNLDSTLVDDYTVVTPLTHVTAFMASYSDFNDLSTIAPMTQLRELHIGATQIDDLGGLSNFPNLTLLHAQRLNNVRDFTAITQLTGLTELAIGGNDLGDMAFLRGLNALASLNLANADISDMDVLRRLPALQEIDLIGANLPDDITVLTRLPNLTFVSVTPWALNDGQAAVIEQLRANGVTVENEVAMIVC